ncbi:MAG TPA: HNH endonuclease signature motif containing protein [Kofleriaceae bacterium]|nr:HNH endonuclease signature motif containing protein [Kofleriaceae bacterium]
MAFQDLITTTSIVSRYCTRDLLSTIWIRIRYVLRNAHEQRRRTTMLMGSTRELETGSEPAVAGRLPEWKEVDRRLREYARHRSALDAAELFDLVRAEQLKIHVCCGCSTLYDYMERVLGYGPHAARERMRVARALATLPETTAALARGGLTYSAVRELTRVATPETETAWLAAAVGRVASEVEQLVANHRPGDGPEDPTDPDLRPRRVRLELPPEVYALWRQARMVIAEERGGEVSDADLVETLCRAVIAPGSGAERPAYQIAYQQCPDCQRATQNGAGREIDVAPEVIERAACDAKLLGSLAAAAPERAKSTVTPRIREQVFARDHHRCTVPGCRSARNLDIHHIIEQACGGSHELWNLTLLCSGHHAALHAGMLRIRGKAPFEREFQWVWGAPQDSRATTRPCPGPHARTPPRSR